MQKYVSIVKDHQMLRDKDISFSGNNKHLHWKYPTELFSKKVNFAKDCHLVKPRSFVTLPSPTDSSCLRNFAYSYDLD